jgi:hypothetical protein
MSFGITSAALAIVGIVILGALFLIKRQESALKSDHELNCPALLARATRCFE